MAFISTIHKVLPAYRLNGFVVAYDHNGFKLVGMIGLAPTLLSEPDPKSGAAALRHMPIKIGQGERIRTSEDLPRPRRTLYPS